VMCNSAEGAQNNPACLAGQTCTNFANNGIPYLASCR
jgi:hypothetical protein